MIREISNHIDNINNLFDLKRSLKDKYLFLLSNGFLTLLISLNMFAYSIANDFILYLIASLFSILLTAIVFFGFESKFYENKKIFKEIKNKKILKILETNMVYDKKEIKHLEKEFSKLPIKIQEIIVKIFEDNANVLITNHKSLKYYLYSYSYYIEEDRTYKVLEKYIKDFKEIKVSDDTNIVFNWIQSYLYTVEKGEFLKYKAPLIDLIKNEDIEESKKEELANVIEETIKRFNKTKSLNKRLDKLKLEKEKLETVEINQKIKLKTAI